MIEVTVTTGKKITITNVEKDDVVLHVRRVKHNGKIELGVLAPLHIKIRKAED